MIPKFFEIAKFNSFLPNTLEKTFNAVSACNPNPCFNSGTCVHTNGVFQTCFCPNAYSGSYCQNYSRKKSFNHLI